MNSSERSKVFLAIQQLQQASALFSKRRAQLASAAGLTEAQWRVMEGIATQHFMPSLFARERQRSYELTAAGVKVMDKLRDLRSEAIEDVWADLPPKELAAFSAFAEKLIARLREKAAESK
jgi:hypothetical protein